MVHNLGLRPKTYFFLKPVFKEIPNKEEVEVGGVIRNHDARLARKHSESFDFADPSAFDRLL